MSAAAEPGAWEVHQLLDILALPHDGEVCWPGEDMWDWLPFAAACDRHRVTAYVYCQLRSLPRALIPAGLFEHLRTRFHEICARNYHLAQSLVQLTSTFHAEGLPVLALKGPSLAIAIYGGLSLREYNDLDLLIQEQHHLKAVELMTRLGFEIEPLPALTLIRPFLGRPEDPRSVARTYEIAFRAPDGAYYVDLHWQLGDLFWRPLSPRVEEFWERAQRQELLQGKIFTLCREDLFLALCAHGSKHRWGSLKWLLDIAQLLRNTGPLDWSRIEEMIRIRPGAGAPASLALVLANGLLRAPIPAKAWKILPATSRTLALASAIREELLQPGRTPASERSTLFALEPRSSAQLKYWAIRFAGFPGDLFRELVLQVSPKDRALIRLPPRLQFLYYLIRPVRLFVKHSLRVTRLWRS